MEESKQNILAKEILYDILMNVETQLLKAQKYSAVLIEDIKESEEMVDKLSKVVAQVEMLITEVENEK